MSDRFDWNLVELHDIVELHGLAIEHWGGSDVQTPKDGCVEGAIGAAKTASLYQAIDDEPDLLTAVAYLLRSLAKNHCFSDGNKRVAWMAAVRCLLMNGITVSATVTEEEAAELVERVVTDSITMSGLIDWFASRVDGIVDPPRDGRS